MNNNIKINDISIDIIVPVYKPNDSIKLLLYCLLSQTIMPSKIIIINSGSSNKINNYLESLTNKYVHIIHKKVKKINPGEARNVGINLSRSKYISFFDVNTFPKLDWIEENVRLIKKTNSKVIYGKRITLANTKSKKINQWSTYGDVSYVSLTGTIIQSNFLKKNNLYFHSPRAGEDIEWIERSKKFNNAELVFTSNIYYNGLFNSVIKSIIKWFFYAFAYSNIRRDLTHQKKLFFIIMIYLLFFSIIIYKISITLLFIFLLVNFSFYFMYFSIFRPIKKNVPLNMLFPFNWFLIGLYRFMLDLAKLPGMIYGQLKIFLYKLKP